MTGWDTLSSVLGRPNRYLKPGALRYAIHALRTLHLPPAMMMVATAIYTVARLDRAGGLTDVVQTVPAGPRGPCAEQNRRPWQQPV